MNLSALTSNIKSIQRGAYTGTGGTVTITSVNTAKSLLLINGGINTTGGQEAYAELTNGTTITIGAVYVNGLAMVVRWQVIEFN